MGKIYLRKTNRQGWSKETMTTAVAEVKRGASMNGTAKKYNLPEATLRRYAKKYSEEVTKHFFEYKFIYIIWSLFFRLGR